jgi:hypothetical protein
MESALHSDNQPAEVSDEELLKVIADFLEMGYVENIVAMFRQESRYYQWVGDLLTDERFAVRLGVSVLFEYLQEDRPEELVLALPSLTKALQHGAGWVRGEAVSVLAMVPGAEALALIKTMLDDPDAQVAAIAREIIEESAAGDTQ